MTLLPAHNRGGKELVYERFPKSQVGTKTYGPFFVSPWPAVHFKFDADAASNPLDLQLEWYLDDPSKVSPTRSISVKTFPKDTELFFPQLGPWLVIRVRDTGSLGILYGLVVEVVKVVVPRTPTSVSGGL